MLLTFLLVVGGIWGARRLARWIESQMVIEYRPPFEVMRGMEYLVPREAQTQHDRAIDLRGDQTVSLANSTAPLTLLHTGVMITGAAGSGKSRLIVELLHGLLGTIRPGSGNRVVLFDPKNEFMPILAAMADDAIPIYQLNPFEARGTRWRIAEDVHDIATAITAAMAVIPEQASDANVFFSKAGRGVLRNLLQVFLAYGAGRWTLRQWITVCQSPKLAKAILKCHPPTAASADQFLEGKSGRDVAATATANLDTYSAAGAAWDRADGDLSIREILATECIVVLGWDDTIGPALSAMYGLFLELLVNEALMNQDANRRTYLVIDELRMLPKNCGQALNRAAFRGRSSAVCPIVAFQDWNSLVEVYGQTGANELAANFQTKLFLKQGSDEAAEWAAKWLGKVEALWRTNGYSHANNYGHNGGTTLTWSWNEHIGDRFLIHPAQLRGLPLADPVRDRIVGYWMSSVLTGPTLFEASFRQLAAQFPPHPDYPAYIRRPAADQVAAPFSAADADALNLPSTDDLIAALAQR